MPVGGKAVTATGLFVAFRIHAREADKQTLPDSPWWTAKFDCRLMATMNQSINHPVTFRSEKLSPIDDNPVARGTGQRRPQNDNNNIFQKVINDGTRLAKVICDKQLGLSPS